MDMLDKLWRVSLGTMYYFLLFLMMAAANLVFNLAFAFRAAGGHLSDFTQGTVTYTYWSENGHAARMVVVGWKQVFIEAALVGAVWALSHLWVDFRPWHREHRSASNVQTQ